MRTHYEILGIRPGASAAEIRAAYIGLMKRHHPDSGGGASAEASAINDAFAALRDPAARARYDDQLEQARRREVARRLQSVTAYAPTYRPVQRPRRRGRKIGLALIALTAAWGFAQYYADPDATLLALPDLGEVMDDIEVPDVASLKTGGSAALRTPVEQWNVDDSIADFEWFVRQGETRIAENYSRQCFDEFESNPVAQLVDRCIAFDLAVSYWDAGRSERDGIPRTHYFARRPRDERHMEALGRVEASAAAAEARLAQIEHRTVSAMATQIIETQNPPRDPPRARSSEGTAP